MPQALMAAVVIPAISALLKDYPQVSVELIAETHIDLFAENIDLAIRVGESKDNNKTLYWRLSRCALCDT